MSAINATIIEARAINKTYIKKSSSVHAAKNVNLQLNPGKFYSIMGHSGSGKTSLLQILGLLDEMTSGELYIDGKSTAGIHDKEKARIRNTMIGFVFQSCFLNPKLKAIENVMLPLYVNPSVKTAEMKERAMNLLSQLGIEDRAGHYPKELSGGEQQRVAIARALVNDPHCVFADEPTGNLDRENEAVVFDYLKKLSAQGKCVLVVSHNEIVKEYTDELFIMENGVLAHA